MSILLVFCSRGFVRKWVTLQAMQRVLAILLGAVLAPPTSAKEVAIPTKQISSVVLSYAGSIGCGAKFDPSNIVKVAGRFNRSTEGYIAIYYLDVGCDGGSGSATSAFAFLGRGSHGELFVDPELSRPGATLGFPQSVTKLRVKNGDVWYEAKDFDFSKDALCCPSVNVSGKLSAISRDAQLNGVISTTWYWVDEKKNN